MKYKLFFYFEYPLNHCLSDLDMDEVGASGHGIRMSDVTLCETLARDSL